MDMGIIIGEMILKSVMRVYFGDIFDDLDGGIMAWVWWI